MKPRDLLLPLAMSAGALFLLWPRPATGSAPPGPSGGQRPVVLGGRVMSPFGPRRTASGAQETHYGIDLAAPAGTPVYCPIDGVVAAAYPDGEVSGYGNVLTIQHGSMALLFAHLATMAVRTGETIHAGQLVGTVGSTNSEGGFHSSGPHLHLEVMALPPGPAGDRAAAHYTGTTPPRSDPAAWAAQNGFRLLG